MGIADFHLTRHARLRGCGTYGPSGYRFDLSARRNRYATSDFGGIGQVFDLDKSKFPSLFQKRVWPWGPIIAEFETNPEPPTELISNVNMVPYVEDGNWVIIRHGGGWCITGGTLEPGESYMEAIERELMEEAGARLISFQYLGAWHCHSQADRPYRPHLPWPEFFRVVGYGQVEIVADPGNPEDGEQVSEVACLPLEEACTRLSRNPDDGPDLAELYRLAALARSGKNW